MLTPGLRELGADSLTSLLIPSIIINPRSKTLLRIASLGPSKCRFQNHMLSLDLSCSQAKDVLSFSECPSFVVNVCLVVLGHQQFCSSAGFPLGTCTPSRRSTNLMPPIQRLSDPLKEVNGKCGWPVMK